MAKIKFAIILVLFLMFSSFVFAGSDSVPAANSNEPEKSSSRMRNTVIGSSLFRDLAAQISPAVVNIRALKKIKLKYGDFHYGMEGTPRRPFSDDYEILVEGSGFIISKDGYILTTTHVVAESDLLQVTFYTGKMIQARLVGMDPVSDVALIKIDPPFELKVIPLGSSQNLQPGDWVIAIGSPFGLQLTVTAGIVSGLGRSLGKSPYDDFIQIDAPINPGNSGGPLLNTRGEVVGINAAIIPEGQGLGFSVPIDLVKKLLPQLKDKGKVVRSWLGVVVQDISITTRDSLDLPGDQGSLVVNILPDSPAQKAGILIDDVIYEFDGYTIKSSHEFPRRIANSPSGKEIKVKLIRGNRILTLQVVLEDFLENDLR